MSIFAYQIILIIVLVSAAFSIVISLRQQRKINELKQLIKNEEERFRNIRTRLEEAHYHQLNPHLLKNSLNAILSHAYQTYHTMDQLAQALDYLLYESPNRLVSPKDEINFVLNLIEINKIKLSPLFNIRTKIHVDERIEPLYEQKVLVPLIAIDLIENAFKHTDFQNLQSFIYITIEFVNSVLQITVTNKVSRKLPLLKSKGGIGSRTLEERLQMYYTGRYVLKRFVENETYNAYLQIDLNEQ